MRQLIAALALAATGLLVAGCSSANQGISASTTSTTAPPVAVNALAGLLLSPDQINTAMGATGMTVSDNLTPRWATSSADVSDKACLPLDDARGRRGLCRQCVERPVRELAARAQRHIRVILSVRLWFCFPPGMMRARSSPPPPKAGRPAPTGGTGVKPDEGWTVGQVFNTNGTLSATQTEESQNEVGTVSGR